LRKRFDESRNAAKTSLEPTTWIGEGIWNGATLRCKLLGETGKVRGLWRCSHLELGHWYANNSRHNPAQLASQASPGHSNSQFCWSNWLVNLRKQKLENIYLCVTTKQRNQASQARKKGKKKHGEDACADFRNTHTDGSRPQMEWHMHTQSQWWQCRTVVQRCGTSQHTTGGGLSDEHTHTHTHSHHQKSDQLHTHNFKIAHRYRLKTCSNGFK